MTTPSNARRKLNYPATARNRQAIFSKLRDVVSDGDVVLEIASGSGQHALFFAEQLPQVTWHPSSYEKAERASIGAYRDERPELENLREPIAIDVHERPWPIEVVNVVFCANMIHIAPWSACLALFGGAAECLSKGGHLVTYGPYRFDGNYTAESNASFDRSLRHRNAAWGVRDLTELKKVAKSVGLKLSRSDALPANNHLLVWTS